MYEFERYSSKKCIWLKQDWNQFSIHYEYIQFNEGRYFHVKSYVPGPFYPSWKISTYFIIERDCVVVISIFIWSIMWKISSFRQFKFWQFLDFFLKCELIYVLESKEKISDKALKGIVVNWICYDNWISKINIMIYIIFTLFYCILLCCFQNIEIDKYKYRLQIDLSNILLRLAIKDGS